MTGWERETRTRWNSRYSTWSTSLDRPETTLLLSGRDQRHPRLHVHMPGMEPVNLSSPAPGHHAPGCSGCQAATISTMMTTIIAQSSWPEVCGRRNPRTRCARCHSQSRPSAFPASSSEEKKPAPQQARYRGLPVRPVRTALRAWGFPAYRFCNPVADRRPAGFPLAARCLPPGRSRSAARHEPSRLGMRVCPISARGNLSCESRWHTSSTTQPASKPDY